AAVRGPATWVGSPKVPPAKRSRTSPGSVGGDVVGCSWRQEGPRNERFRSRGAPVNDQHRPRGRRTMIDRRPYPVSGAWRPGDDPGLRRFLSIAVDRPFALDRGGRLPAVAIAY